MSVYIEDLKTKTVRQYCTTPKIEKAIETLLRAADITESETTEGYRVSYEAIPWEDDLNNTYGN